MKQLLAIAIIVAFAGPAIGKTETDLNADVSVKVDRQADAFLKLLQAGKGAAAVDGIFGSSPLWANKIGTKEQLVGQIDSAIRAYGPISGFEKIQTDALGSMVIRENYLVQHRDMVVRWEFDFVRGTAGWTIGHFGFTDTPEAWF